MKSFFKVFVTIESSTDVASEIDYYDVYLLGELDFAVAIEELRLISVYCELTTNSGDIQNYLNVYVALVEGGWYVVDTK